MLLEGDVPWLDTFWKYSLHPSRSITLCTSVSETGPQYVCVCVCVCVNNYNTALGSAVRDYTFLEDMANLTCVEIFRVLEWMELFSSTWKAPPSPYLPT